MLSLPDTPRLPERGTPEGPASDTSAGWLAVEVPQVGSATPSVASSHASCSGKNGGESGSIRSSVVGSTPGWHEQEQELRLLKDRRTAGTTCYSVAGCTWIATAQLPQLGRPLPLRCGLRRTRPTAAPVVNHN